MCKALRTLKPMTAQEIPLHSPALEVQMSSLVAVRALMKLKYEEEWGSGR